MTFYERFKFLCDEKGVSPAQAARENGVTQQAASHWKQRGTTPKSETLWKFVSYFDTNIDFLLGKQGAPVRCEQIFPDKKTIPYREKSFQSDYQEYLAIEKYLDEMGYKITVEFSVDEGKRWTIYDKRNQMGYLVPPGRIAKLTNGITAFARYQINELLSELCAPAAPQPPPAPQEGKNTTPPPNAPETPPEGE